jgi:hypothetical protein
VGHNKNFEPSEAESEMSHIKTGSIPLASTSAAAVIEANLPQPLADSDIAKELSSIDTKITNFVLSYFTGGKPGPDDVVKATNDAVTLLGRQLPVSGQTLANLLANPAQRHAALQLLVGSILLSRIQSSCASDRSLLPPGITAVVHSMPQTASGDPGKCFVHEKLHSLIFI